VNGLVSEQVTFKVSKHVLHGVFTSRSDLPGLCALLLHPHPLFGGSMDDRVIRFLESLLANDGHSTFRFGFRGSSSTPEGYSGMRGAADDALAAVELLRSRYGQNRIAYIGYSFGGATALRFSCEMMPSYLVTLSASLALTTEGGYSLDNLRRIQCPTLMFHGTDDRMVQTSDLEALARAVGTEAKMILLNGEDHFYQTCLQAVGDAIRHFLSKGDRRHE
jgi:alpha/beta superfamily hydrolase